MNRRTSTAVILILTVTAALLVGCSGNQGGSSKGTYGGSTSGTGGSSATTTIVEKGFAFSPATTTVKVGDTVTFENQDSAPHNVQIDGKELGQQSQGESKTWTASKAGSFPYKCIIHPSMTGEITVK